MANLQEVEENILKYTFSNKMLLEEAFTHNSFSGTKEFSYHKLEYIGDSILNSIFDMLHLFKYRDLWPGSPSRLLSVNVDTEKLARAAFTHGLHLYLRHNICSFQQQIEDFSHEILEYPQYSNGLIYAPKVLANIVESTIGAVLKDSRSVHTVWKVCKELLEPLITPETLKKHPVAELREVCQKRHLKLFFDDLPEESMSIVNVYVDNQFVARGIHPFKKDIAKHRAAKAALDKILETDHHKYDINTCIDNQSPSSRAKTSKSLFDDVIRSLDDLMRSPDEAFKAGHSQQLVYEPTGKTELWLNRSTVGIVQKFEDLLKVQDMMNERKISGSVRPLGGNRVIITFSYEKVLYGLTTGRTWLSEYFDEIRPWSKNDESFLRFQNDAGNGRYVWLNCYNVPLYIWEEEFFSSIAYRFGEFVCVDKDTVNLKRFDVAKVLIFTNSNKFIDQMIDVIVDGTCHKIKVVEQENASNSSYSYNDSREKGKPDFEWRQRRKSF